MRRTLALLLALAASPALAQEFRFPPGWQGDAFCEWHSRVLEAAGEAALWSVTDPGREVYRVTILPASRPSVTIRAEVQADGGLDLRGAVVEEVRDPDAEETCAQIGWRLSREWRVEVSPENAGPFLFLARAPDFGAMDRSGPFIGSDGTTTVAEGLRGGIWWGLDRWHIRRYAGPDTSYRRVGALAEMLTGLAGCADRNCF